MKPVSLLNACLLFFCSLFLLDCSAKKPVKVAITTEYGEIEIELYDQTPLHRDNFVKLVNEGFYDGTLFHRVIQEFMIQGGDPDSRDAQPGTMLGRGGPGYTVPAEFDTTLIHKRGALAAARQGDNVNPTQASSGSQFYIVQGKKYTDEELDQVEIQIAQGTARQKFNQYMREEEEALKKEGKEVDMMDIQMKANQKASEYLRKNPYRMSKKNREIYKTIGGTPLLDGAYTIFGEVTKGLEVVDAIAALETDDFDRPRKDVKMTMKIIK